MKSFRLINVITELLVQGTQCGKHCFRLLVYIFLHFWILNQSVGNAFDSVFVEKYIVQITNH
jgi:hypothetical protein